jgi:hypothetical protein
LSFLNRLSTGGETFPESVHPLEKNRFQGHFFNTSSNTFYCCKKLICICITIHNNSSEKVSQNRQRDLNAHNDLFIEWFTVVKRATYRGPELRPSPHLETRGTFNE